MEIERASGEIDTYYLFAKCSPQPKLFLWDRRVEFGSCPVLGDKVIHFFIPLNECNNLPVIGHPC